MGPLGAKSLGLGIRPGISARKPTYLDLPGTSGSYASTPDSIPLSITGDIDIRIKMVANDWSPAAINALITKWNGISGFVLYLLLDGTFLFAFISPTGEVYIYSSVVNNITNGATKWIRFALDVDNGAGNCVGRYYLSDDGASWTQLGSAVTVAGTRSIVDGTAPVYIGRVYDSFPLAGKVYSAEIRNGIDGTLVANPRFDLRRPNTTSFADAQGNTWTVNGSAVIH